MVKEYVYESLILNVILIVITAWITRKLFNINSDFNDFKSKRDNDILEARKDSTKKQRATIKGQISETLAPWSMTIVDSVSELNFLGNPIDFIGFKGLDGKGDIDIKFIEVKSGKSKLNSNQRRVRDAVIAKRIEWAEVRISEIQIEEKFIQ
ncbi:MAG: Holliday junction resolvase-like protein [Candidatus Poseidoniaceae archaeon]